MSFLQTKKGKKIMGMVYGLGGAIVILGALFKIQHWPGASPMLILGLGTEACIFTISAFEPPHEEVDWSLVYPELVGLHDEDHEHGGGVTAKKESTDTITQELDKMLEEAKIGPELIESLGAGMKKFSEQTEKLTNITDAGLASDEFASNIKSASKSVENLSDSYGKANNAILSSTDELAKSYDTAKDAILSSTGELAKTYGIAKESIVSSTDELAQSYNKASQSIENLVVSNRESHDTYGTELQKVSKNLAALNAVYEMQLQESNNQSQATANMYNNINSLVTNITDSIEDTQKYKEEIAKLSSNLNALNNVYGNMLSAMKIS